MAGLRQTTQTLARYRRQFEKLVAASAAAETLTRAGRPTGRLTEIPDFGANPGNLRMLTYRAEACPPVAPLVVVLHGCTQTAAGYDDGAGWSTLADRHGFALLFPEQQRTNNPNVCFNWFQPEDITRGRGEAASIHAMIEHLAAGQGIDRTRVFVTGLSAGGAMAAVMLATYPEVFAGGAIIAGLPYRVAGNVQEALDAMFQGRSLPARSWGDLVRRASPHDGPWPKVSIWHGSADQTVKPMNASELVKQWTDLHGFQEAATAEERVNGYPREIWRSAAGETLVESYTITGMAHGTPIAAGSGEGSAGAAGPFILETGISSSYLIARFWGIAGHVEGASGDSGRSEAARAAHPTETSRARGPTALSSQPVPRIGRAASAVAARAPRAAKAILPDPAAVITKALKKAGLLKR